MNNGIIFIAGIHGVGKTTLCNMVKEKLNINTFSSSALIQKANKQKNFIDKHADDVKENQDILLQAIHQYIDEKNITMLDGHFILINGNNELEQVPVSTFEGMNIINVILIVDDPQQILERLVERDNHKYNLEFIKKFQDEEIRWAKEVCKTIQKECYIYDKRNNNINFVDVIKRLVY